MPRHFQTDLDHMRELVLEMGALTLQAIHSSVASLDGSIPGAAIEVTDRIEPRVNELHREIDQRALDLLALQQPMAVDLRFLTAVTRINTDLERMSDRATNIAHKAVSMLALSRPKTVIEIPRMAELTEDMVSDAMAAFRDRDEQLARGILRRDREVDDYRDVVYRELIAEVSSEKRFVEQALDLILVSRNLERIADHATNIAEAVIFMVLGTDIRHRAGETGS